VHPFFRLLGWSLLVAVLVGVLWPERPEHLAGAALESHAAPDKGRASAMPSPPCPTDPGCGALIPEAGG
jgi:hypothetical protein